jgi:hypothetical protein
LTISSVPETCVVYLAWEPLGTQPVAQFAASYRANPGGFPHRLALLVNGAGSPEFGRECAAALAGLVGETLTTEAPLTDLAAYFWAAKRVPEPHLCFLNSYSEPLDPAWLQKMHDALRPGVGLVGACGSYESFSSNSPLITRPLRLAQFPPFPNAHVRTNTFLIPRDVFARVRPGRLRTKLDTWKLESGRRNITRQVIGMGMEPVVAGRDGRAYDRRHFYESNTFRRGNQANLLVADNRTVEFAEAPPERRRWLFELAWGPAARDTDDPGARWEPPSA